MSPACRRSTTWTPPSASAGSPTSIPIEPLTDHFYTVLGQLHQEARAWETSAPAAEEMTPATMAKLFQQALRAVEAAASP